MPGKLLIVAGESSGELYGALLARELFREFELFGIGGEKMAQAGVKLVGQITHSFGAFEVISHFKKIQKNMENAVKIMPELDGVILIDFPDFNLNLAKRAKKSGKKVLYYVSPQIWAWRKGRIKTIKEVVDFMAVVLPFEEHIYKNTGIAVSFVGHPMFEVMKEELKQQSKTELRERFGIKQDTVVTLMPGSRPAEIKKMLPLMLSIVKRFDKKNTHFIIPKAPNIELSENYLKAITSSGNITILKEQAFTALAMSDSAIITSGTSTLQATLLQIPMIVVYRVNPLSYIIGKALIKGVKHIALPNVIADFMGIDGTRLPEFIQKLDENRIFNEMKRMIYDADYRQEIVKFLQKIRAYFLNKEPSKEVAQICRKLFLGHG